MAENEASRMDWIKWEPGRKWSKTCRLSVHPQERLHEHAQKLKDLRSPEREKIAHDSVLDEWLRKWVPQEGYDVGRDWKVTGSQLQMRAEKTGKSSAGPDGWTACKLA